MSLPAQTILPTGTSQDQQHSSPTATATNNPGLNTPTLQTSNFEYEEDAEAGHKRKWVIRHKVEEASRQQGEHNQNMFRYNTPDQPIKKCLQTRIRLADDRYLDSKIKCDDDYGYYVVVPNADLTPDYRIIHPLGRGTFSQVGKAHDRKHNKAVAVKIIRSGSQFHNMGPHEIRVLATLKANDSENRKRCIHFRDCFKYRGHICIVMDLLGKSVFDFLHENDYVPFPMGHIQSLARQLFTSVAFLHDLGIVHTDLKPENMVLCNSAYNTFKYNQNIPSSSSAMPPRLALQRKVLLDTDMRLVDFGSAAFNDEPHAPQVTTRHYRAPEVILGLGWSIQCDIWSIGCILVELFTGTHLFIGHFLTDSTEDNLVHLAMMEAVVGSNIHRHLVQSLGTWNGGVLAAQYQKRYERGLPTSDAVRVRGMKPLEATIPDNTKFRQNFLALLKSIFVFDKQKRITAKEALDHPWFQEADDTEGGTVAACCKEAARGCEE